MPLLREELLLLRRVLVLFDLVRVDEGWTRLLVVLTLVLGCVVPLVFVLILVLALEFVASLLLLLTVLVFVFDLELAELTVLRLPIEVLVEEFLSIEDVPRSVFV